MMIKPSLDKVKNRDQRKLVDVTLVSLSASDLRTTHFFVQPNGVVYQMAPLSDVLSDRNTVEIDMLEPTKDAVDSITNILVALATGSGERIPKLYIERGSGDVIKQDIVNKINKDVKYLIDTGVERLPSQFGIIQ